MPYFAFADTNAVLPMPSLKTTTEFTKRTQIKPSPVGEGGPPLAVDEVSPNTNQLLIRQPAAATFLPEEGFFTFRIIYKKDRESQASSVLLSVGNVFYSVYRTVLNGTKP